MEKQPPNPKYSREMCNQYVALCPVTNVDLLRMRMESRFHILQIPQSRKRTADIIAMPRSHSLVRAFPAYVF